MPSDRAEEILKRRSRADLSNDARVKHFAEIEREHGKPLTDPKQRALHTAQHDDEMPADKAIGAVRRGAD